MCSLIGKVQAIQEHPTPSTKKLVQQFLGLVGYYRHFIPDFATIAIPLTGLFTKDQPLRVRWTPDCEAAIQELKRCLCHEPRLYSPDFT